MHRYHLREDRSGAGVEGNETAFNLVECVSEIAFSGRMKYRLLLRSRRLERVQVLAKDLIIDVRPAPSSAIGWVTA